MFKYIYLIALILNLNLLFASMLREPIGYEMRIERTQKERRERELRARIENENNILKQLKISISQDKLNQLFLDSIKLHFYIGVSKSIKLGANDIDGALTVAKNHSYVYGDPQMDKIKKLLIDQIIFCRAGNNNLLAILRDKNLVDIILNYLLSVKIINIPEQSLCVIL